MVDKFSEYAHFVPLSHPFTAMKVAMLYMDHIFKLHGLPQAIISDRDRIFTSHLWHELFKLSGTDLKLSTAYHPQTDGQTECVNQCLEAYLRCFVHGCPTKWKQWLPLAEFWYNTSYHSSLGKTPFEVLYGHEPRHLGIDRIESCAVDDLKEWLSNRKVMIQLLQQHLCRAQQRQKSYADKNRTEHQFQLGDFVYLKLQPYIQQSVMPRANYKLSFRYFGPFKILEKIGTVAYRLQLPPSSSIHPVFHVSQLKCAICMDTQVSSTLPPTCTQFQIPQQILQCRMVCHNNQTIPQVLVKWSSWPSSMSTWENETLLRQNFPVAPAWGQPGSDGGGNVMTNTDAADSLEHTVADSELKKEAGVGRPHRNRKPNVKFFGSAWRPK